jgi:DivIVA domain-containing protein
VVGDDVRGLRISVAFRGYRMTEVDWLLEQLAEALDERDAAVAAVRARDARGVGAHADVHDTDPEGFAVPAPEEQERPGA